MEIESAESLGYYLVRCRESYSRVEKVILCKPRCSHRGNLVNLERVTNCRITFDDFIIYNETLQAAGEFYLQMSLPCVYRLYSSSPAAVRPWCSSSFSCSFFQMWMLLGSTTSVTRAVLSSPSTATTISCSSVCLKVPRDLSSHHLRRRLPL